MIVGPLTQGGVRLRSATTRLTLGYNKLPLRGKKDVEAERSRTPPLGKMP
ncbi:hypothetical protein ACFL27_07460 [candidate division CSSED10-310 bacterium]|uniref:Uncharacterized protein n=1 Tax=candidate division CSSED10-310 bacterium TaxID=2855610 RepID=A0ABV6YUY3_UNCC1